MSEILVMLTAKEMSIIASKAMMHDTSSHLMKNNIKLWFAKWREKSEKSELYVIFTIFSHWLHRTPHKRENTISSSLGWLPPFKKIWANLDSSETEPFATVRLVTMSSKVSCLFWTLTKPSRCFVFVPFQTLGWCTTAIVSNWKFGGSKQTATHAVS